VVARRPSASAIVPIPVTDFATADSFTVHLLSYRENQERYILIKFAVRGRDLGSAVLDAHQEDLPNNFNGLWIPL